MSDAPNHDDNNNAARANERTAGTGTRLAALPPIDLHWSKDGGATWHSCADAPRAASTKEGPAEPTA